MTGLMVRAQTQPPTVSIMGSILSTPASSELLDCLLTVGVVMTPRELSMVLTTL